MTQQLCFPPVIGSGFCLTEEARKEYRKVATQYKNSRKQIFGRNDALVCYSTAEEAKISLAEINMYQGWTTEMCRSTSKHEENRVKEGSREEQNKAVGESQQNEREDTNSSEVVLYLIDQLTFDFDLIRRDLVVETFRNKFSYLNYFIITPIYKFLQ